MSCKLGDVINELYRLLGKIENSENAELRPVRTAQVESLISALKEEGIALGSAKFSKDIDQEAGNVELVNNGQLELDFSIEGATRQVFDAWKYAIEVEQLQGNELQERVKELLKQAGVEFVKEDGSVYNLGVEVLENGYGNKIDGKNVNNEPLYEVVRPARDKKTNAIKIDKETGSIVEWEVSLQASPAKDGTEENTQADPEKTPVVINRKVEMNPNKFMQSNGQMTVVNSIPMGIWPKMIRDKVEEFRSVLENTLVPLSKQDLFAGASGRFSLHNTPAMGLVYGNVRFDKDSNVVSSISPAVSSAMYMALLDNVSNNRSKMLPGDKPDVDVAEMFGVAEFEVTPEMRMFARNNGVLVKTLASDIGKDVMSRLGYSKKQMEGVN